MADERIEDITGGELTVIAPDDKMVILDKSDTTDDADGTAKYIELATLGLLQTRVTSPNADITGAVGVLDVADISGFTADRDYILPTTAAVGDRAGVCVSTGDDTYELDLHTVSASSDTINGVDSSVGTASWSRLFITGEIVIFRCVVANTAWIVEYDGRKPSSGWFNLAADGTGSSWPASTWTVPPFDEYHDTVGTIGSVSNDYFTLRRTNWYSFDMIASSTGSIDDGIVTSAGLYDGGTDFRSLGFSVAQGAASASIRVAGSFLSYVDITADAIRKGVAYHTHSAALEFKGDVNTVQENLRTYFKCVEIL